jgi:hypothetical protein
MDDNDARYRDILQRIAASRATPATLGLDAVLDTLNVLDDLEEMVRRKPPTFFLHGPGVYKGKNWQGVLVWYRRKGWQSYKKLMIFGIWAMQTEEHIRIVAGTKTLAYTAAVYTAEAYHTLIKRDFRTYYGDEGSSPDGIEIIYEVHYHPTLRLSLRRALAQVIKDMAAAMKKPSLNPTEP